MLVAQVYTQRLAKQRLASQQLPCVAKASFFSMTKKTLGESLQSVAPGATIAECQQQLLQQLRSGNYALSSSDKEGYRTLCYYRGAFLFVSVGDDGTGVLRLPQDDILLNYV